MADNERKIELQVDELRRHYDNIFTGLNHTRDKALALLGGEVAIVAFLFAAEGSDKSFIPNITFGIVFGLLGVGMLATAFVLFLMVLAPIHWYHPPSAIRLSDSDDHVNDNSESFLKYLKKEYVRTIGECIIKVSSRSKKFTWGLYLLSIGTFILILIKYGGGYIKL